MEPLRLVIGGYNVSIQKRADGSVAMTIDLGFLGSSTLVIPQWEWQQIEEYLRQP